MSVVDRLRSTSATLVSMVTDTEKNNSLEEHKQKTNRTKQKETTLGQQQGPTGAIKDCGKGKNK